MGRQNPYAQALLAAGGSNAVYLQILVEGLAPSDRRRRKIPLDVVAGVLEQLLHRHELPSAREIEERLRSGADAPSVSRDVFESVKEAAQRVLDEDKTPHRAYIKANNDRITNFLATLVTLRCEKVTMLRERQQPDGSVLDDYAGLIKAAALAGKAVQAIKQGIEDEVALVAAEIKGADLPVRVLARRMAKSFADEVNTEATAHFVTDRKGAPSKAEISAFSQRVAGMWADTVRDFSQSCPLPVLKDGMRCEPVLDFGIPREHLLKIPVWTRIKRALQSIGTLGAGSAALASGLTLAACLWAPSHSFIEASLNHTPVTADMVERTLGTIFAVSASWWSWASLTHSGLRTELAKLFSKKAQQAERRLGDLLLEGYREAAQATLRRAREIAEAGTKEHLSMLTEIGDVASQLAFDMKRNFDAPSTKVA